MAANDDLCADIDFRLFDAVQGENESDFTISSEENTVRSAKKEDDPETRKERLFAQAMTGRSFDRSRERSSSKTNSLSVGTSLSESGGISCSRSDGIRSSLMRSSLTDSISGGDPHSLSRRSAWTQETPISSESTDFKRTSEEKTPAGSADDYFARLTDLNKEVTETKPAVRSSCGSLFSDRPAVQTKHRSNRFVSFFRLAFLLFFLTIGSWALYGVGLSDQTVFWSDVFAKQIRFVKSSFVPESTSLFHQTVYVHHAESDPTSN